MFPGEPSEDDSLPIELTKEEEDLFGKEETEETEELKKRSTRDQVLHYDYKKKDLGTGGKGVEKYSTQREDEVETAVKKPALPFYCSIPLVSR